MANENDLQDYRDASPEPPEPPAKEVPGRWFYIKRGLPVILKYSVLVILGVTGVVLGLNGFLLIVDFAFHMASSSDWVHQRCHLPDTWTLPHVLSNSIIAVGLLVLGLKGAEDIGRKEHR